MAPIYPVVYEEQPYVFSAHAQIRMTQWNLTKADVLYVIQNGQKFHRHGILFFFLGKKDFPKNDARELARLEGTTVLLNPGSRIVITAYRNRQALHKIKGKVDYYDPDIRFGRKEAHHG